MASGPHAEDAGQAGVRRRGQPEVVLDNKNCRFEPHVMVMSTSEKLVIKNSDPVGHNSKLEPVKNPAFNSLIPAGQQVDDPLSKEETLPVKVGCSIHPWMGAWIIVRAILMPRSATKTAISAGRLPAGKESNSNCGRKRSASRKTSKFEGGQGRRQGPLQAEAHARRRPEAHFQGSADKWVGPGWSQRPSARWHRGHVRRIGPNRMGIPSMEPVAAVLAAIVCPAVVCRRLRPVRLRPISAERSRIDAPQLYRRATAVSWPTCCTPCSARPTSRLYQATGLNREWVEAASGPVWGDNTACLGHLPRHCVHCHGTTGDGDGPTAALLNPYPQLKPRPVQIQIDPACQRTDRSRSGARQAVGKGRPTPASRRSICCPRVKWPSWSNTWKSLTLRGQTEYALAAAISDLSEGESAALDSPLPTCEISDVGCSRLIQNSQTTCSRRPDVIGRVDTARARLCIQPHGQLRRRSWPANRQSHQFDIEQTAPGICLCTRKEAQGRSSTGLPPPTKWRRHVSPAPERPSRAGNGELDRLAGR